MKKEESRVRRSYQDLEKSKKTMLTSNIVLSIALLMSIGYSFTKTSEKIITPMEFHEPIIINGEKANAGYQKQFAWTLAANIGNIDSRNVEFVTERVLEFLSPFLRSQLSGTLKQEAQILKVRGVKQSFQIDDIFYNDFHDVVFVTGQKTLENKSGKTDRTRWTYEFRIQPKSGFPRVTHFDAYKGVPNVETQGEEYKVSPKPYLDVQTANAINSKDPDKAIYSNSKASEGVNNETE